MLPIALPRSRIGLRMPTGRTMGVALLAPRQVNCLMNASSEPCSAIFFAIMLLLVHVTVLPLTVHVRTNLDGTFITKMSMMQTAWTASTNCN